MKTIIDTKDDAQFMSALYDVSEELYKLIKLTGLEEVRKKLPDISSDDTEEERQKKIQAQSTANIVEMAKILMKEHPKETISVVQKMIFLEEGEDYPHGFEMLNLAFKLLTAPEVLDFFTSIMRLSQ